MLYVNEENLGENETCDTSVAHATTPEKIMAGSAE